MHLRSDMKKLYIDPSIILPFKHFHLSFVISGISCIGSIYYHKIKLQRYEGNSIKGIWHHINRIDYSSFYCHDDSIYTTIKEFRLHHDVEDK